MKKLILFLFLIIFSLVFVLKSVLSPKARQIIKPSNIKHVEDIGYYSFKQTHPFMESKNIAFLVYDWGLQFSLDFAVGFVKSAKDIDRKVYKTFLYEKMPSFSNDVVTSISALDVLEKEENSIVLITKKDYFSLNISSFSTHTKMLFFTNYFDLNKISVRSKSDCNVFAKGQERLSCLSQNRSQHYFAKRKSVDLSKLIVAVDEIKEKSYIVLYNFDKKISE